MPYKEEKLREVKILPRHIELAKIKEAEFRKKVERQRNSIRNGEGVFDGCLGEVLAAEAIGAELVSTVDYDLKKGDHTIDVKTKMCSDMPWDTCNCSVADYNTEQNCGHYLFVRIQYGYERAWIMGKMEKDAFYKNAKFYEEGEVDPLSSKKSPYKFPASCWNMYLKDIEPIKYETT